jgi:hypothetical protein
MPFGWRLSCWGTIRAGAWIDHRWIYEPSTWEFMDSAWGSLSTNSLGAQLAREFVFPCVWQHHVVPEITSLQNSESHFTVPSSFKRRRREYWEATRRSLDTTVRSRLSWERLLGGLNDERKYPGLGGHSNINWAIQQRATLRLRRNNRAKKGTPRRSVSYPFSFFPLSLSL